MGGGDTKEKRERHTITTMEKRETKKRKQRERSGAGGRGGIKAAVVTFATLIPHTVEIETTGGAEAKARENLEKRKYSGCTVATVR